MSRKLAGSVGYFPSDVSQTFISLSVDCCSAHSSLCCSIMASLVTVVHSDVSGSGTAFSGSGSGDVVISVGWSSGLLDEDIVEVDASAASLEISVGGTLGTLGSGVLVLVWQGRPIVNLAPPVCYSWEFTRNINIQLSIIWYFIIYF